MIFFGHRFIESENFYHINSIEAIDNTPPSSTIFLEFSEENLDIITFASQNSVPMALHVRNITELLYASSLGALFIIVEKELAKSAHDIAQNYLFDAKVLVFVTDESEIEELGLFGVDGVIFPNTIINLFYGDI